MSEKPARRNQIYKATQEKERQILSLTSGRCCRCGLDWNIADHTPVTWRCIACKGFCCRKCALINPANREYYGETYCSFACRDAWRVQSSMLGLSLEDD